MKQMNLTVYLVENLPKEELFQWTLKHGNLSIHSTKDISLRKKNPVFVVIMLVLRAFY